MRISIVYGPFLPVPALRGGAIEKSWMSLASEFSRAGHTVSQISRSFEGLPDDDWVEGVHNRRVAGFDTPASWRPMRKFDVLWPSRLIFDWVYARRAVAVLPPADVVVTHSVFAPIIAARDLRKGAVYVHVGRFPKFQMCWYSRAARLQAPSEAVASAIIRILSGHSERVRTIPYPLEQIMLEAPPIVPRDRRIIFAGRIHPQKGLDILVAAFVRFSQTALGHDWKLVLIGAEDAARGGGGEEYGNRLRDLGRPAHSKIEWRGFIGGSLELREELRSAPIFIYPSIDEGGETFGVGALEAMAQGCAAIVSDLACFRDFVKNDVNACVFDHRLPDASERLYRLIATLATSSERCISLGLAAQLTTANYSSPKIASMFLLDFASLAEKTL